MAEKIGINQSVAVTCVKPSGTVSQLVDAASGIHARHNPYYIRTVRGDKKDPLTKMMIDAGFPVEDDVMNPSHTSVFSFPMKVEKGAVFRTDMDAIEQLEMWLTYQKHWCEHKPSVTITVKEHEWMQVGAWVYDNFDYMSGISFLPFSEHSYKQAPYQDIEEKQYEEVSKMLPKEVDWSKLSEYELTDTTVASQELACAAGGCEIL
jgi:ribonucleoside-diphosphate reductase alpha chain